MTVLCVLCVGAVAPTPVAVGQDSPDVPRRIRESVALDTNNAVSKKLGAVQEYLAAKQWNQAIDLLADVSTQHGDLLAPVGPGRYVRVSSQCQQILADAPREALAVYRRQVDPQAKQWFEAGRTGDDEALQRIVRNAFVSSYGDDAVELLAEWAWERGDPAAARRLWEKLLPADKADTSSGPLRYPDASLPRAEIAARLVLCGVAAGERQRAKAELDAFRAAHGDAEGRLAGETGRLATILERVLSDEMTWPAPPVDDAATTFALTPQRAGTTRESVEIGAPQWSEKLIPPIIVPSGRSLFPERRPLCFHPLVHRDLVFVNDGLRVWGWKLFPSELTARRADAAWPAGVGDPGVIFTLMSDDGAPITAQPLREPVGSPHFTLTIAENRLYARMGSPVTGKSRLVTQELRSKIICLDLDRQAKVKWEKTVGDLFEGTDWEFDGTPLVAAGRAWVVARKSQPQMQLHLVCFDAESGELLWNRKACTAVAPLVDTKNLLTHLLLTLGDEGLYLSTDLGAILAFDPADGSPLWAATYESRDAAPADVPTVPAPCLYARGLVLAAPNDSDRVLAIEAASGATRWERRLVGGSKELLGVTRDGALIVSGERLWALDLATGQTRWQVAGDAPGKGGYGRGALAGDLVYWPRREELLLVRQKDGALHARRNLKERELGTGGNLVIADGMLLVAEADRLVAYGEYGLLKKRTERVISQNPHDAATRLRMAMLHEATGDFQSAAANYRNAIDAQSIARTAARPGRPVVTPVGGLAREWLFEMSRKRGELKARNGRGELALASLGDAVTTAPDVPREISSRIALAQAAERFDAPRLAAETWLSLLTRSDLSTHRTVTLSRRDFGATHVPLEGLARQSLARLWEKHPATIAPWVDERSARWRQGDRAAAEERLRLFPFARDAPETLAALADQYEKDGAAARAAQLLREHASLGSMRAVRPALRNRLDTLTASLGFSHPQTTASEAGPWRAAWRAEVEPGANLLVPLGSPTERIACVLTQEVRLSCVNAVDGAARWSRLIESPVHWASFAGIHLLVGGQTEVTALSPDDGSVRWRLPVGAPSESIAADISSRRLVRRGAVREARGASRRDESQEPTGDHRRRVRFHATQDRLLVFDIDRVVGVDAWTGRVLWEFASTGPLGPHWRADDRGALVQDAVDGRVLRINATDGEATEISTPTDREPWRVPPTSFGTDGVAAVLTNHRVVGLCATSPAAPQGWRFEGGLSWANTLPALTATGDALLLIGDGDTLTRLDGATGRPLWSRAIARTPLAEPARSVALSDTRAYVAADGFLRAYELRDGTLAWEEYVGDSDQAATVRILGETVAVCATRPSPSLMILDGATGRPHQRLAIPERPSDKPDENLRPQALPAHVRIDVVGGDSLIVRHGRTVAAYRPWTTADAR